MPTPSPQAPKTKTATSNLLLVAVFGLLLILAFIESVLRHTRFSPFDSPLLTLLIFALPILLVSLHAFSTLNIRRGILFFGAAACVGMACEIVGVKHGALFGGEYTYDPKAFGPLVFGVPLLIGAYWAFFLYTGYTISTSLLAWRGLEKPNKHNKQILLLAVLVLLDAAIVVSMDLIMDPIKVYEKNWTWAQSGVYFGVPLTNFLGWACISAFVTGLFRLGEYLRPRQPKDLDKKTMLFPIIGYQAFGSMFMFKAILLGIATSALLGFGVMSAATTVFLLIYFKRKRIAPQAISTQGNKRSFLLAHTGPEQKQKWLEEVQDTSTHIFS